MCRAKIKKGFIVSQSGKIEKNINLHKDKKSIYFTGLETSDKTNLENFSRSIFNLTMGGITSPPGFKDFQTAFGYIYDIAKDERIILVIDEFPYLAKAYQAISSMLQIQIDWKYKEPQMYNEIITEIAAKAGLETAVCGKYLISLITLGIIKKERPIIAGNTKKTIYRLADNMFRFWYRFVPQNISQIYAGGGGEPILSKRAGRKSILSPLTMFAPFFVSANGLTHLWDVTSLTD